MKISIFQYTGNKYSNVAFAKLIKIVEIDTFPQNQFAFARYYGGDFLECEFDFDNELLETISLH